MKKITQQEFISRATKIHHGRYDYSLAVVNRRSDYVRIICPIHGEYLQKADYHLNGNGCPKCFGTPKLDTGSFIAKAKELYGDQYDYSKVDYQGNKVKVCIVCPTHGEWWVTPNNFLRGSRCPGCYGTPKHTSDEFVRMAKKVHGEKYDYSEVTYDGLKHKVKIICPIHGPFFQSAGSHLNGSGCPDCTGLFRNGKRIKITRATFIKRSMANHATKYDYSKVSFKETSEKVCIICPKHGEFWQSVTFHLQGGNCPKCVGGVRLTTQEFVEKAHKVHGTKYDYSKVEYKNTATKVCIVCPIHGDFWQTPNNHLFGAGCPACPQSNLEGEMREFLLNKGILFEQEKGFDWLRFKRKLFLDFYLPDYKIAIECQGGQHFKPVNLFGGETFFEKTLARDRSKRELCAKHGIKILYFSNAHIEYPYPVIETYAELLNEIQGLHSVKNAG